MSEKRPSAELFADVPELAFPGQAADPTGFKQRRSASMEQMRDGSLLGKWAAIEHGAIHPVGDSRTTVRLR